MIVITSCHYPIPYLHLEFSNRVVVEIFSSFAHLSRELQIVSPWGYFSCYFPNSASFSLKLLYYFSKFCVFSLVSQYYFSALLTVPLCVRLYLRTCGGYFRRRRQTLLKLAGHPKEIPANFERRKDAEKREIAWEIEIEKTKSEK